MFRKPATKFFIVATVIVSAATYVVNVTAEGTRIRDISCVNNYTEEGQHFSASDVIKFLGWIRDPNEHNLCGGHYSLTPNIAGTPNPESITDAPLNITATKPAFFTQSGASVLQGDVKLTQPGREVSADRITFFRDNKTGKISKSILLGNVSFNEYGKLLVAERGNMDFVNKTYSLDNGIYRLLARTPTGLANVWGRAKKAVRDAFGNLKLHQATYSTCPPDATSWHLFGNDLMLDRAAGRGEIKNAVIFLRKMPVFYIPYLTFSTDQSRKSGFLYPIPKYLSTAGYGLALPYYFNLAPNYDATFTPEYASRSGVLFSGLFRYLTAANSGNISLNYIHHDRAFIDFRNNAAFSYPQSHELSVLQKSSNARAFLSLQNQTTFNQHWSGLLNVNYATDDYFLQNFGITPTSIDRDQLLNQADIRYASEHWQLLGRLQMFQTLHPLTQNAVQDQYRRLPQINFSGDFPDEMFGLDYDLDGEVINFTHRDNFYTPVPTPVVAGGRLHFAPAMSLPLSWIGGYVTPKLQLQTTVYSIHDGQEVPEKNIIERVLPIISVDSGMVFTKSVNFFRHVYVQNLEPKLFYLFVPTKNQDEIPIFDTNLPALDFSELFHTNRFSGIDRIGDANQVTAAITTRLLDDDGQEKINASFGQIISMHRHQVIVPQSTILDPLTKEILSPMVGQVRYFITPQINTTANIAWDPNYHRFNAGSANIQYINADKVVNLWYNYTLRGDPSTQKPYADLSRVGVSFGWKLWQSWRAVGNLNYNISHLRAQDLFYGLEYDSCCWAIRFAHGKTFIGIDINNQASYNSTFYVQFLLKGLGSFGSGGLGGALANQVSGYQDKFITGQL